MSKLGLSGSEIKKHLDKTSLSDEDKKIIQELIEKNNEGIEKNVASVVAKENMKEARKKGFSIR